jgi:hypothetical protein
VGSQFTFVAQLQVELQLNFVAQLQVELQQREKSSESMLTPNLLFVSIASGVVTEREII